MVGVTPEEPDAPRRHLEWIGEAAAMRHRWFRKGGPGRARKGSDSGGRLKVPEQSGMWEPVTHRIAVNGVRRLEAKLWGEAARGQAS